MGITKRCTVPGKAAPGCEKEPARKAGFPITQAFSKRYTLLSGRREPAAKKLFHLPNRNAGLARFFLQILEFLLGRR